MVCINIGQSTFVIVRALEELLKTYKEKGLDDKKIPYDFPHIIIERVDHVIKHFKINAVQY